MKKILTVNPGATSTKYAVFEDDKVVLKKVVEHQGDALQVFKRVFDQCSYRLDLITAGLKEAGIPLDSLDAVVGRGGLLKPMVGGTYAVNDKMLEDLEKAERGEHASNLGAAMAFKLASSLEIPAYIVDPVSVDELQPVARITGFPDLERVSMAHALNMKAVARKVAAELGKKYQDINVVVAHMGTGISLSAQSGGKMIDVVDGKEEGSFGPDRCGGLPASQLVKLCYSGKYTYEELKRKLFGSGGIYAYLGTKDARDVEKMAEEGNEKAELLLQALAYQVSKDIAALSAVLSGKVERIILTGGIAYSKRIVADITKRVEFIAPVAVIPGEEELESLAAGARRVLNGEEQAQLYQ